VAMTPPAMAGAAEDSTMSEFPGKMEDRSMF
jgi:hypothetical protein